MHKGYNVSQRYGMLFVFKARRKMTYMDVGNADIAGANICHPCSLDGSILATDSLGSK
jgi:hypothetical protein